MTAKKENTKGEKKVKRPSKLSDALRANLRRRKEADKNKWVS